MTKAGGARALGALLVFQLCPRVQAQIKPVPAPRGAVGAFSSPSVLPSLFATTPAALLPAALLAAQAVSSVEPAAGGGPELAAAAIPAERTAIAEALVERPGERAAFEREGAFSSASGAAALFDGRTSESSRMGNISVPGTEDGAAAEKGVYFGSPYVLRQYEMPPEAFHFSFYVDDREQALSILGAIRSALPEFHSARIENGRVIRDEYPWIREDFEIDGLLKADLRWHQRTVTTTNDKTITLRVAPYGENMERLAASQKLYQALRLLNLREGVASRSSSEPLSNNSRRAEWAQNTYEKWSKGLTSNERGALIKLGDFSYRDIQAHLRAPPHVKLFQRSDYANEEDYADAIDRFRDTVRWGDSAIRKGLIDRPLTVYRNDDRPGILDLWRRLMSDRNPALVRPLKDGGYLFTTLDPQIAGHWFGPMNEYDKSAVVLIEIEVPEGARAAFLDLNRRSGYLELVFGRDSTLLPLEALRSEDGTRILRVKLQAASIALVLEGGSGLGGRSGGTAVLPGAAESLPGEEGDEGR
ncbi:MAG: ADP-ribosyltransferase [Elusimicrobiota bacterium]